MQTKTEEMGKKSFFSSSKRYRAETQEERENVRNSTNTTEAIGCIGTS